MRGFRPCVFLGGLGDRLKLLGLKHGEGKRVFDPVDSFQRTLYQGGWRHGLRHGIGVLRYNREHIQARRYEAVSSCRERESSSCNTSRFLSPTSSSF